MPVRLARPSGLAPRAACAAVLAVVLAGCAGIGSPDGAAPGTGQTPDDQPAATSGIPAPSTAPVRPDRPAAEPGHPAAEWLTVSADYPRYLHHLRRVNLQTVNTGDEDVTIGRRLLVSEHFTDVDAIEDRTSTVWAGTQVDIQADFGEVVSCEDRGPLRSWVEYDVATGSAPVPVRVAIPIDPTPLEEIRQRECARQAVFEVVDLRLTSPVREGGRVLATLAADRRAGDVEVRFGSMLGSVIFTMSPVDVDPPWILERTEDSLSIPLVFDVARCDPHAVSQSTKTWEFSIRVTVGDRQELSVPIPVDPAVRGELEDLLSECLADQTG